MIRLFIIDRTPAMCDTMSKVMAHEPDISVVGCSTSVSGALPRLHDTDVVLVTADLPSANVQGLIQTVAADYPAVRVVVMDCSETQQSILKYATAGLAAYVFEEESVEDLLAKMRALRASEEAESATSSLPRTLRGFGPASHGGRDH